jgi:hypothetical protein
LPQPEAALRSAALSVEGMSDPALEGIVYHQIEFLPEDGADGRLVLMVRVHGSIVGHIRRDSTGLYRYDRMMGNNPGLVYEERDLETLLRQVGRNP